MRVLITGAAGFLGRHFLDRHLEQGDDVIAIDNFQSPYAVGRTDIVVQDCRDHFTLESARAYDRIYHFAAMVGGREKIEFDPLFNADSLELDALFFRWVSVEPPSEFVVYPSSSAVYGVKHQRQGSRQLLREEMVEFDQSEGWDRPDEMYGLTKLTGEYLAWKAARYGVRTLCIRPFSGYGKDQSPEYPMRAIAERVKAKENPLFVWGPGTQVRDWIHVSDIVRATVSCVHQQPEYRDGRYLALNIGTGSGRSMLEVAQLMAAQAGYRPDIATIVTKPAGVMVRIADVTRMSMYHSPRVKLEQGIKEMLDG